MIIKSSSFENCVSVGESLPDIYSYDTEKYCKAPSPDLVVSRNKYGLPISTYKENKWDYLTYSSNPKKFRYIDFENLIPNNYIDEVKLYFFIIERVSNTGRGRNNNTYAVSSLYRIINYFLRPLALFSEQKNIRISNLLSDESLMKCYLKALMAEDLQLNVLSFQPSLNALQSISPINLGFHISIQDEDLKKLNKHCIDIKNSRNQHPIIPPQKYADICLHSWKIMDEVIGVVDELVEAIQVLACIPPRDSKDFQRSIHLPIMNKLLSCSKLCAFLKAHYGDSYISHKRGNGYNFEYISKDTVMKAVKDIQHACKTLILFYSGMRSTEAQRLPLSCFSKHKGSGRSRSRIIGYTFKYSGYDQRAEWVTSDRIDVVIKILVKIAKSLAANFANEISIENNNSHNKKECPLFLTPFLIIKETVPDIPVVTYFGNLSNNALYDGCNLKLNKQDISFLNRVDPERDWSSEEAYKIGNAWNLTDHQLRRSLVFYALTSGKVELGAAQTQLKHLFNIVTSYYGRGFENIDFDVSSKGHFAEYFIEESPSVEYFDFINQIVFSEERIFGGQGNAYERKFGKMTPETKHVWYKSNRKAMVKKFKAGEITMKDTPIGSCCSTAPCNDRLTLNLTACFSCQDSVIFCSKIKSTIEVKEKFRDKLEPLSIEYVTESKEIIELKKQLKKLSKEEYVKS